MMSMLPLIALVYYLILNLAVLVAYGVDKSAARRGRWRTRESVLLGLGLAGGAFGGLLGMVLFRHKTRKPAFWAANLTSAAVHLYLISQLIR